MAKVIAAVVAAVALSGVAYGQGVLELRGPGSQVGVRIADSEDGVAIREVRSGTPADRAGFKAGDVVVSFDGEEIRSARQLTRVVDETPPGRSVTAVVMRDGSRQTLTVTPEAAGAADVERRLRDRDFTFAIPNRGLTADLERRLRDRDFNFNILPNRGRAVRSRLGVELTPLSDQLAQYFGCRRWTPTRRLLALA